MPQPCLTEKGVEIMRPLKEVLEENKQAYIQRLMDLIAIDTHDLGHGIAGAGVYGEIVRGYGSG